MSRTLLLPSNAVLNIPVFPGGRLHASVVLLKGHLLKSVSVALEKVGSPRKEVAPESGGTPKVPANLPLSDRAGINSVDRTVGDELLVKPFADLAGSCMNLSCESHIPVNTYKLLLYVAPMSSGTNAAADTASSVTRNCAVSVHWERGLLAN